MSISIAEAAKLLRISQKEIYQQLRNGQLTSRSIGNRRVITEGGLQEYLARKQQRLRHRTYARRISREGF